LEQNKQRIVVKVGTSTLTHNSGALALWSMEHLVRTLADLQGMGHEVILVSSGAIAVGTAKLGLSERPKELRMKQAAAAVGQCRMMHIYDKFFSEYNRSMAQILLTGDDVEDPERAEHLSNTFSALLEMGVIPVVNENDSVSSAEIETGRHKVLGDNDTLSAIVAELCRADLLVLLSDIDGLYDADPKTHPEAKLLHQVTELTPEILEMAGGAGNTYESVVAQQGLTEALVYGSWQNWLIAALTLTAVLVLNHKAKGICKLASILIGMLFGYAVALCFGMVSFADVGNAAWFALPEPLHFGLKFDPASCVAIGLLFAINSIQAIGDFTATTVGGLDRDPTDQELQGGIIAYGTSNILTALMGGLPTATYSQNVGIVTTNKVVNRTVFAIAGGFLLLAGISPKFAALLTTIPQCVLGGATVTVFSTIAMTGMKLIASQDLTARNTTIVGLSAALGVGISQASEALSQFPEAFTMVFGQSPVVIATIMAVLLNLILPKEK